MVASIRVKEWVLTRQHYFLLRRTFMMVFPKRAFMVIVGLVLVMVVSACGSTTSTGSTSSTPAATPTTASTSTVQTAQATVQTAQATVNGKALTIFTSAQGLTLYYFAPDTADKVACTGGCAKTWPPLVFTGSGTPTSSTSVPGKL